MEKQLEKHNVKGDYFTSPTLQSGIQQSKSFVSRPHQIYPLINIPGHFKEIRLILYCLEVAKYKGYKQGQMRVRERVDYINVQYATGT